MMMLWWCFPYIALECWLDHTERMLDMVTHNHFPDVTKMVAQAEILPFKRGAA